MVGSMAARRFIHFQTRLGDRSPTAFIDDDRLGPLVIIAPVAHVHMAFFCCMRGD